MREVINSNHQILKMKLSKDICMLVQLIKSFWLIANVADRDYDGFILYPNRYFGSAILT